MATESLTTSSDKLGYGVFKHNEDVVLTKQGSKKRSLWNQATEKLAFYRYSSLLTKGKRLERIERANGFASLRNVGKPDYKR